MNLKYIEIVVKRQDFGKNNDYIWLGNLRLHLVSLDKFFVLKCKIFFLKLGFF